MSFILDALKKSEERRRLQEEDWKPRQKVLDLTWSGQRRWPVWMLLVVLLVALACGWWLRGVSPQPSTGSQPIGSTVSVPPELISPAVMSPGAVAPATAIETPSFRGADPAPYAPVPVGKTVKPATDRPRPVTEEAALPEVRIPVRSPTPATPVARQQQTSGKVSAALRDRISRLTMSLHFYAGDPAQRMVRIDNRIMREGQALADDLVLEEITPRGVIFSSSGERVELQRPGGQP